MTVVEVPAAFHWLTIISSSFCITPYFFYLLRYPHSKRNSSNFLPGAYFLPCWIILNFPMLSYQSGCHCCPHRPDLVFGEASPQYQFVGYILTLVLSYLGRRLTISRSNACISCLSRTGRGHYAQPFCPPEPLPSFLELPWQYQRGKCYGQRHAEC
jgi:hypothetical protein